MNRIIGVESWYAVCTPIEALVAPGAARDEADARPAGELAVGVGHEGGAAFLAVDDQADAARVVQRVEHREVALAGNAERVVDAVDQQLVDENAAAGASHDRAFLEVRQCSAGAAP